MLRLVLAGLESPAPQQQTQMGNEGQLELEPSGAVWLAKRNCAGRVAVAALPSMPRAPSPGSSPKAVRFADLTPKQVRGEQPRARDGCDASGVQVSGSGKLGSRGWQYRKRGLGQRIGVRRAR
eukprot:1794402-Rhodomonas_salina.1